MIVQSESIPNCLVFRGGAPRIEFLLNSKHYHTKYPPTIKLRR